MTRTTGPWPSKVQTAARKTRRTHAPRRAVRVNARLDAETAAALQQLVRETGLGVTDLLKLALLRLSEQYAGPPQPIAEAFAGLIGSFEGPADLSGHYKGELTTSLARKHGQR